MKICVTIDGLECKAESDYAPDPSLDVEIREAIKATSFDRLCTEMKRVAFKLIEEKYGRNKDNSC